MSKAAGANAVVEFVSVQLDVVKWRHVRTPSRAGLLGETEIVELAKVNQSTSAVVLIVGYITTHVQCESENLYHVRKWKLVSTLNSMLYSVTERK